MIELIEANWPLFVIALLIGIAVAWWIFVATRRTSVKTDKTDALDEGAAPAARNQALIDAPSTRAPPVPPVVPPGLAGAGTAVAAVVEEQQIAAETASGSAAASAGGADDLSRIKGVGPKLQAQLVSLGVTKFSQIAAWGEDDIDRIDAQLGRFQGRIRRDSWTDQAALLASGDTAGYEEKFGKL